MCDHHPTDISRRGFAGLAALGVGLSLLPRQAFAQVEPPGDTLCLMCIDHWYAADAIAFFDLHAGRKNYDLVSLAGASLAAIKTTNFPDTYLGLWEQVAFAQKPASGEPQLLHPSIKNVTVLDHMNCGAYKAEFGPNLTREQELRKHFDVANEVGPLFGAKGLNTNIWLLDADTRKSEWIWPLEKR
jgi:hypothetical protein